MYMVNHDHDEPRQLRQVAKDLRESARFAELPGYAQKLILAAEQLERRAAELEAKR